MRLTLTLTCLALLCAGCGQKGPLYFAPEPAAERTSAADTSNDTSDTETNNNADTPAEQ